VLFLEENVEIGQNLESIQKNVPKFDNGYVDDLVLCFEEFFEVLYEFSNDL
jgi:hypothetical protein